MQDTLSYDLGQKIGAGLNGDIYRSQQRNFLREITSQLAIKVFNSHSEFKCEEEVLQELDHPNIIKILHKESNQNQMVMKYYNNGDLFDFLQSDGREIITEEIARFFFKQILKAVEYIHQKNIIHRDIKLENILVDEDFNLILSDFGLSSKVERGQMFHEYIGTQFYMAPEIVSQKDKYYGQSSDIFAMGVILFCIMIGTYPFQTQAVPTDNHYQYFFKKNYIRYWLLIEKQQGKTFSVHFKQLINQLLTYDMNERITMEEILDHEWLKAGPTATPEDIREALNNFQKKQSAHAQN